MIRYKLRNGLSVRTRPEYDNNVVFTPTGQRYALTEDLRGGVYGAGYDVVGTLSAGIKISDLSSPSHLADAMTFAVDPAARVDLRQSVRDDISRIERRAIEEMTHPGKKAIKIMSELLNDVRNRNDAIRVSLPTGELPMSETNTNYDGFYTVDFYAGEEVCRMSDKQIFNAVQSLQAELKTVSKLGGKSKAVKAHQKRINKNINRMMSAVNSRY